MFPRKPVFILCALIIVSAVFFVARFILIIDLNEVCELKNHEISNINQEEIISRDYIFFRKRIEIYKATNAIEANLRLVFKAMKERATKSDVSSGSFLCFQKMNSATSNEDAAKYANFIINDNFAYHFLHTIAVKKMVLIYLENDDKTAAFKILCLGFTEPRTPNLVDFGYYFNNLLEATEAFLISANDFGQIKRIKELLIEGKKIANLNFQKNSQVAALKLRLFLFDYLILICKLKLKEDETAVKLTLIRTLEKFLKLNFILEVFDKPILSTSETYYLKAILEFVRTGCAGSPPNRNRFQRGYIQKSTLFSVLKFLIFQDEVSIFAPAR